jgi:hypothetical protein
MLSSIPYLWTFEQFSMACSSEMPRHVVSGSQLRYSAVGSLGTSTKDAVMGTHFLRRLGTFCY